MNNWLNPSIPFSLAHFWSRTSLFQADLSYFLFAPIVLADPRINMPAGADPRDRLVKGVIAEVTRAFSPDWSVFDKLLIVGAQATDQFGGGPFQVSVGQDQKNVLVAVVDVLSPFSNVCQELGHAFALDHELNYQGDEYRSPYSVMSSEGYGGSSSSFERPVDARLPVGKPVPPNISRVQTQDVQRIIGPYITPVQFSLKNMGTFNDPQTVHRVPDSYGTAPYTFHLTAVDACIDSWPNRKMMLAVLPPQVSGGDVYHLELRRNHGYDAALSVDGSTGPPVALVIHAVSSRTNRVLYVDRIALGAAPGDMDYHSYKGFFAVRVNSFEKDFSACSITVGGGNFWKYLGVGFDDVIETHEDHIGIGWQTADMSPCFLFPKAPHHYRDRFRSTFLTVRATSFGYEKPNYQWFVNDKLLNLGGSSITQTLSVQHAEHGELSGARPDSVPFECSVVANVLKLTCHAPFANIHAVIKVVVNETSTEVLQSLYPDRSLWMSVDIDNVKIEYDQAYIDQMKECVKRIRGISDRFSISDMVVPHRVDPGPKFGKETIDLINALILANPVAANSAINELARLKNVGKLDVIAVLR
ncbi:MAG: hypothetical protein ABI887_05485 [Burkholderiales bacterium]